MPPEKGNPRGPSRPQVSARHLFSAVIEKREVDVGALDEQQRVVFDNALAGQSLFVTGGAGWYGVIHLSCSFEIISRFRQIVSFEGHNRRAKAKIRSCIHGRCYRQHWNGQ